MTDPVHGKNSTYCNHMCRCVPCKTAHAVKERAARKQRAEALRAKLRRQAK